MSLFQGFLGVVKDSENYRQFTLDTQTTYVYREGRKVTDLPATFLALLSLGVVWSPSVGYLVG